MKREGASRWNFAHFTYQVSFSAPAFLFADSPA